MTAEKLWTTEVPTKLTNPTRGHEFGSSPVLYQGLVCVVEQSGSLVAFDQATGVVKENREMDPSVTKPVPLGNYSFASPCVAGDYLFVTHNNGTTVVYQGKDLKEVGRNILEPPGAKGKTLFVRASLAFAGNRIFCRGSSALYCVGGK
jgi:hypothetical protein